MSFKYYGERFFRLLERFSKLSGRAIKRAWLILAGQSVLAARLFVYCYCILLFFLTMCFVMVLYILR